MKRIKTLTSLLAVMAVTLASAGDGSFYTQKLPRPDGKPADMKKPVKVFILLGQSNMVGMGNATGDKEGALENAVKNEGLYPFLLDDAGNWSVRNDVRNVRVMVGRGGGMRLFNNEWMSVAGKGGKAGGKIGVEFAVGHQLGNYFDEPVMILKSCIGNRSLGWDLLPPGSKGFEFTGKDKKTGKDVTYTYAGYKESPMKWEKGTQPEKTVGWYAGKQWDDDIANAKKVLSELDKYYPGAKKYEVAGFFWWQGEKDCGDEGLSAQYEKNLVNLIKALRKEFDAPKAKFVMATIGEAKKGVGGNTEKVLDAMLALDSNSGKHPEFKGSVATVFSNPMARGGSGNGHYGGNAKVYMDVGLTMGEAMVELLKNK